MSSAYGATGSRRSSRWVDPVLPFQLFMDLLMPVEVYSGWDMYAPPVHSMVTVGAGAGTGAGICTTGARGMNGARSGRARAAQRNDESLV